MAPDRSRSSTLGSSRAPPGSPGAVLTGAGSVCMMTALLPTRSASQRKHVSDLLAMVGDNTETTRVMLFCWLGPESWPLGRALLPMGGLGIMFEIMRRQSGGCRRHQRCLRDGHREHGGHLLATAEAVYCLIFRRQSFGRRLQPCGRAGGHLAGSPATWRAQERRRHGPLR